MKKRTYAIGASFLTLEFGDLTKSSADVVVSSDDAYITMGGGVSAAILRAGGESILIDAAKKVPARLGDVVVTAGGRLPAKHVFHAITIGEGTLRPREVIARTTRRCLELLDTLDLGSIAFPAIGAGVARFAYKDVAIHMAEALVEYLAGSQRRIDVTLYLYDRFRQMEPMDFLDFFEAFALRTNGIERVRPSGHRKRGDGKMATTPKRRSKQEQRKELLKELGQLEGERQELEATLATSDDVLTKAETRKIEHRLKDVHAKRVAVLSTVRPQSAQRAVAVFVSYSHADERLRRELGKQLRALERQGLISTWHDRMIGAGSEWEGAIDSHLKEARVILLLVSADFVDSRYCYDVEMREALKRHARRESLVIPVIMRPVVLRGMPFAKLQVLPTDARAATDWPSLDSAFVNITEGVRDAIQGIGAAQPSLAADGAPRRR